MRAPSHLDNYRTDGGGIFISPDMEDFSDYLWMEDVESFDKQVLAELEEEEEMEMEMQEMLAEEEARDTTYYVVDELSRTVIACPALAFRAAASGNICDAGILLMSELNPEAAEFVPSGQGSAAGSAKPGGGGDAAPDR